jgi:hypothetical protein
MVPCSQLQQQWTADSRRGKHGASKEASSRTQSFGGSPCHTGRVQHNAYQMLARRCCWCCSAAGQINRCCTVIATLHCAVHLQTTPHTYTTVCFSTCATESNKMRSCLRCCVVSIPHRHLDARDMSKTPLVLPDTGCYTVVPLSSIVTLSSQPNTPVRNKASHRHHCLLQHRCD